MTFLDLKKYDVIYCDPPWNYKGAKQHNGKEVTKAAEEHYPTITLEDLKKFPIDNYAHKKQCTLFMWTTGTHKDQAMELGKAWRFKYITEGFVWDKMRPNPGHSTLSQCEFCLIFRRGKRLSPRNLTMRQPVYRPKLQHSAKPNAVRRRIEKMYCEASRIELFARIGFENWDAFGNDKNIAKSHNHCQECDGEGFFQKTDTYNISITKCEACEGLGFHGRI